MLLGLMVLMAGGVINLYLQGQLNVIFWAGMVAVVLIIPVASLMRTIETLFVELEEL